MTEIKLAAKTSLPVLALLIAVLASGLAQERIELRGRVKDVTGAQLPGASVFVRDLAPFRFEPAPTALAPRRPTLRLLRRRSRSWMLGEPRWSWCSLRRS